MHYSRHVRLEACRSCRCHIKVGLGCPFCGVGPTQASSIDARWLGLAVPLLAVIGCGSPNPGPQGEIYGSPEMMDPPSAKRPAPAPVDSKPASQEKETPEKKSADGVSPDGKPTEPEGDAKPEGDTAKPPKTE